MRNLQEQVKKAFCCQKLFWPFTVWTNCSSDLKTFANSSFSRSLEIFVLTIGQNNFGNKIPFLSRYNIFFFLITYVIPLALMAVCYSRMGWHLWGKRARAALGKDLFRNGRRWMGGMAKWWCLIACHFSQDHTMVTKILDFVNKHIK